MVCKGSCHCGNTVKSGGSDIYINVRCLEGVDLDKIPLHHCDGRSA
jgi:hypothetical protein